MTHFRRPSIIACLTVATLVLSSSGAHATTIVPNTFSDELNADGDCSLREAIQAANTSAAVDGCPAGSGADEAKLQVQGKKREPGGPDLGLTLPVTVQLLTDDGVSTACWQTEFATSQKNTSALFKAKGP